MNHDQRKYFLVTKHGFSSKYIDYPYKDLTTRQKNLLKTHTIKENETTWKKGDNFIVSTSTSGWGTKGIRKGSVGIVGAAQQDVCRVYFPKIKKWMNFDAEWMEKIEPIYKWSKGKYPNIRCIPITNVTWKKIDKKTWENQEKKRIYDFIITQEGKNKFILDIFYAKIKDSDKAHRDSTDYPTLLEAKIEAKKWL